MLIGGDSNPADPAFVDSSTNLQIGINGAGALDLSNGGTLAARTSYIGFNAGGVGVANVTDQGSQWLHDRDVVVGQFGDGQLNILAGGLVSGEAGYIGASAGGVGQATVSGTGGLGNASSWTHEYELHIGDQGTGTLNVSSGGLVHVATDILIGEAASGTGTLNLLGTAANRGVVETGSISAGLGSATFNINGGLLRALRNEADFLKGFATLTIGSEGLWFDSNGNDIGIATDFSGLGGLTKLGTETLALTGASTYGGGTTIDQGTLQLGNGGTTGSILGDVTNSGTLAFNRSDTALVVAGLITGTGDVHQVGTGLTTLTGNSSFGDTRVSFGELRIDNGATVNSAGGSIGDDGAGAGTLTVTGQNGGVASSWTSSNSMHVGVNGGEGTLNVTNGGQVFSYDGYVGHSGEGHALVTGLGSRWDATNGIDVGLYGEGELTLSDQATISSHSGAVGSSDRGEALISSGASWTVDDQFSIGLYGSGSLRIESGGSLTSRQSYIGAGAGIAGDVVVTGAGSLWEITQYGVTLGNYGNGTLTIEDGGRVVSRNSIDLGISSASASGRLDLLGTPGSRGVLETNGLFGGAGTADVTIDGGIMRALTSTSSFFAYFGSQTVELGSSGGFFDTNGHNIGINPELTGAGGLIKDGLGTLTLNGANSYSGNTVINTGTLRLGNGGTSGSILGDVANSGILAFNRSDVVTFGGTISGAGGVQQVGSGRTTLTADNSGLSGLSSVQSGILSVNGILGGTLEVVGGRLQGTGQVGTTTNFSSGAIAPGNSIGTLTVAGNYVGNGGTIEIETVLSDDSSATDRLIVTGDASGSTNVRVINLGGAGAQTTEGIKIVDIGGLSTGSFTLLGSYTFEGDPAVVAGAYAYRLYHGGVSTPADGDWYLRSALLSSGGPAGPLYQAGAPVYEAYGTALQSFNALETMQQRIGNRSWSPGVVDIGALPDAAGGKSGIWGRILGQQVVLQPEFSTTGADVSISTWQLQAGADHSLYSGDAGELIGGLSARYGTISGDVASAFGNGSIGSAGYGIGGALTWYGSEGFYLDGQANMTWYDSTLTSSTASTTLVSGNDGFGYALGLEAGQRIGLSEDWSATPQVQVSYSGATPDRFTDTYGASMSLTEGDDLKIRMGFSADYQSAWTDEAGQGSRLHAYGIANLYYDLLPQTRTDLAGVELLSRHDRLWGGVGIGGTYSWGDGRYALHGQAGLNTSLLNFGHSYSLTATTAITVKF